MAAPAISDFTLYTTTPLTNTDWATNWGVVVTYLTDGSYDFTFNSATITNDVDIGGDLGVDGNAVVVGNISTSLGTITGALLVGDGTGVTNVTPKDGSVTNAKIGSKAVKTANIDDKAVDTAQINDSAVGTTQIATKAVTQAKITPQASVYFTAATITGISTSPVTIGTISITLATAAKVLVIGCTSMSASTTSFQAYLYIDGGNTALATGFLTGSGGSATVSDVLSLNAGSNTINLNTYKVTGADYQVSYRSLVVVVLGNNS